MKSFTRYTIARYRATLKLTEFDRILICGLGIWAMLIAGAATVLTRDATAFVIVTLFVLAVVIDWMVQIRNGAEGDK